MPFAGEIGYRQIGEILKRRSRFLTRGERVIAEHLLGYLGFKKEQMPRLEARQREEPATQGM